MNFVYFDVYLQCFLFCFNFIHCYMWVQLQVNGQSIDFIKHNAQAAGRTVLRRSQSLTNLRDKPVPSAVKGQVPQ